MKMSKKKKIKRLERENAELREKLKYMEGYYKATLLAIKAANVIKEGVNND